MSNVKERAAARLKVLCVDDNSDVLELEKLLLEREGYEVLVANNGVEGLKLFRDSKVDLVVLDYEMPQMTGAEVAQLLRRVQPTLAIIMVCGTGFPEEAGRVSR